MPEFRIQMSEDDYFEMFRLIQRQITGGDYLRRIRWTALLPVFIAVGALWLGLYLFVPVMGLVALLTWSLPAMGRIGTRRQTRLFLAQRPHAGAETIVTVSDEGYHARSSYQDNRCAWTLFQRVAAHRDGWLLYSGGVAYWLPLHALDDPEQAPEVERILRAHIPDYRQAIP